MSAYRAAGQRGDERPPEIEVYRHVSRARAGFFATAALCLLGGAVSGACGFGRDPSLLSIPVTGVLCAVTLALLGRGRLGLLACA